MASPYTTSAKRAATRKRQYDARPDHYRAKAREQYIRHATKRRTAARATYKADPEKKLAIARRARGLPIPPYPAPSHCECCHRLPGAKRLSLDHDHETGKFRGWLCTSCNVGIGHLGDDLAGIEQAFYYLVDR